VRRGFRFADSPSGFEQVSQSVETKSQQLRDVP
jgi:hypothetical protein